MISEMASQQPGWEKESNLQKLDNFLNTVVIHALVIIVVFIDLLVITGLLLINLKIIQDPNAGCRNGTTEFSTASVKQAELVLHVIQLVIVSVFMIEVILRIVSRGPDFVYDRWQVFDSFVIILTFLLYVCLTEAADRRPVAYPVSYIIALRLWRIGRLYHVIHDKVLHKAESVIGVHIRAATHAEQLVKKNEHRVEQLQKVIDTLQQNLFHYRSIAMSNHSSADRSRSLPHMVSTENVNISSECTNIAGEHEKQPAVESHFIVGMNEPNDTVAAVSERSNESVDNSLKSKQSTISSVVLSTGPNEICPRCYCSYDGEVGNFPDILGDMQQQDTVTEFKGTVQTFPFSNKQCKHAYENVCLRDVHSTFHDVSEGEANDPTNQTNCDRNVVDEAAAVTNQVSHDEPNVEVDLDKPSKLTTSLQNLFPNGADIGSDFSYINQGYLESLTEEELLEIARVSQIPFNQYGSSSVLHKEGIPMTDL